MEKREISERYAEIAYELIQEKEELKHILDSEVEIIYLSSDTEKKSKGRFVCGQCERIPDKYKWSIP